VAESAPRLLLVSFAPFPAATGDATRLAQRIGAFTDAGYAVDVLTPKTPDLPHVSKLAGSRILRVPMPSPQQPPFALRPVEVTAAERCAAFERAVRRQVKGGDYDVVHVLDPWSGHCAVELREAAGDAGAKVVFEASGGLPLFDGDEALGMELRRRERELLRESDLVFVPTDQALLRATGLGTAPARIHRLRPATDLGLFTPQRDRSRRTPAPVRAALVAATLSREEVDLVAAALERLPRAVDVRVFVSAAVPQSVQDRVESSPVLCRRIVFVQPVLYEDLGPFYEHADLGLVVCAGLVRGELPPARLQVIAEMMAAGLAQVLPDVPAVREIATDRLNAMLVRPGDPEALAAAVESLATAPARRSRLARAARDRAVEVLDEMNARSFLLDTYAGLFASGGAGAGTSPGEEVPTNVSGEGGAAGSSPSRRSRRLPSSALRAGTSRPRIAAARLEAEGTTDPDMAIHKRAVLSELMPADPRSERTSPRRR